MMTPKSPQSGFTLLELIVVVTIIGILASVALPQYRNNVIKGTRSDGIQMLTSIMSSQERFFSNEITYTADLSDLGYSSSTEVSSTEEHYKVTASPCSGATIAQCVVLTAVPQEGQASDGNLTLNSRGAKTGNWP